jgi:MFS family permease
MTTTSLQPATRAAEDRRADERRRWITLAILATGQFMALVDVTIVNVAIPTMQAKLHASGAAIQLVVSGYTIAYAMLLVTGARLGDMRGPKLLFQIGLLTFTLASLVCGFSPDVGVLIAARFVQGAGAAAMVPQLLSVIQRQFTGASRLRALSIYTATLAVGSVVGQVAGGLLISANLFGASWRTVFIVNVPIGILLAVLVPRFVPADPAPDHRRLDLRGLATVATSVLLVVLPLVLGHQQGWPTWTWVSLGLGVAGLAAFVRVEKAVAARGGHPLLNLGVFAAAGMPAAVVALMVGMAGYGGFLFSLALDLQEGLGDTALRAGLTFAPAAATFGAMGYFWRQVPAPVHRFLPFVGFSWAALSYLALADYLRHGTAGFALYLLLIALGVGMGAAFSPLMTLALVNVPRHEAPDASGLLTTTMQLSQVIGVAVFGSVFLSLAAHHRVHAFAHATGIVYSLVAGFMVVGVAGTARLARQCRTTS